MARKFLDRNSVILVTILAILVVWMFLADHWRYWH
jgi:hypothetical protein